MEDIINWKTEFTKDWLIVVNSLKESKYDLSVIQIVSDGGYDDGVKRVNAEDINF